MIRQIIHKIMKNHALMLMIVITGVNGGNYLLNIILGKILGPEAFSEAGILATLVMVLSFIAVGIQVTTAKYSAQLKDDLTEDDFFNFQSWIINQTLQSSIFLSLFLTLCVTKISDFLNFESWLPLFIIILGIPLYFLLSVKRGLLQGRQQFNRFALTYIVEMLGRLIITIIGILVVIFVEGNQYTLVVSLGFFASFFFATLFSGELKVYKSKTFPIQLKPIMTFFLIMMGYEGTQIIISYSDVILVKHYFNNQQAGLYAALSLLGRIVYFATWALVMVLVPKVIEEAKKGKSTSNTLIQSLFIIASFGGMMVLATKLFPDFMVEKLMGSEFLPLSNYLWKYALATTLFASANVIAYYYLSLGKYMPVILSAIAGVLQITLISNYHQSIINIINIQVVLMTLLITSMIIYHLSNPTQYENRTSYALSTK